MGPRSPLRRLGQGSNQIMIFLFSCNLFFGLGYSRLSMSVTIMKLCRRRAVYSLWFFCQSSFLFALWLGFAESFFSEVTSCCACIRLGAVHTLLRRKTVFEVLTCGYLCLYTAFPVRRHWRPVHAPRLLKVGRCRRRLSGLQALPLRS